MDDEQSGLIGSEHMPIIKEVVEALKGVIANAECALHCIQSFEPGSYCHGPTVDAIMISVEGTNDTTKLLVKHAAQFEREVPSVYLY